MRSGGAAEPIQNLGQAFARGKCGKRVGYAGPDRHVRSLTGCPGTVRRAQFFLHKREVKPAAELEPDLGQHRNRVIAERRVKRDAARVVRTDTGKNRVNSAISRMIFNASHQVASKALAARFRRENNRMFGRKTIARAAAELAVGCEPPHITIIFVATKTA